MDIRSYIQWAESKIARLVIAEGLHVGLLGVTQGPLTLTFRLRLIRPHRTALSKLLSLGPAFQQVLQVEGVRVVQMPDHIAVEVPSPQPRTPTSFELAMASRRLNVAVGYDSLRRPVHVNLDEHGAIFWIGPSRRGKTQSMRSTLYALAANNPQGLRFAILCHEHPKKHADWSAFEKARACMGIAIDPGEQKRLLEWAVGNLMGIMKDGMSFVILVDDLLNLLKRADLAEPLAEIASVGAGVGIHLLAGTQEGGSRRGTGGAGVENNATAKILYRNSNAAAAARATGQGSSGLQDLSGVKGDALVLLDGHPQRVATGLADDGDIRQLEQGEGWLRPWLRSVSCAGVATGVQPAHSTTSGCATTGNHQSPPAQPPPQRPHDGHIVASEEGGLPTAVEVVASALFPIKKRPPTGQEAAAIRRLRSAGLSLNKLCYRVYGHKDRAALNWIKGALSRPEDETVSETSDAVEIDLTTDEGRTTLRALRDAGVLQDEITETATYH